jgi:hypothetical protein
MRSLVFQIQLTPPYHSLLFHIVSRFRGDLVVDTGPMLRRQVPVSIDVCRVLPAR